MARNFCSQVEPLPHQITAVYEAMLPRQPLRFLLADDPGAGKIIMTGLFIRELVARGDLQRSLIVCPANLVEQWQDELYRRFNLPFAITALPPVVMGGLVGEASRSVSRGEWLWNGCSRGVRLPFGCKEEPARIRSWRAF